jgi:hypothetical protein
MSSFGNCCVRCCSYVWCILLCYIAAELTARPTDVSLRIRLLRLYLDTERVTDAYSHAVEVEVRSVQCFRDELQWYDCLIDVFEVCVFKYYTLIEF